MTSASAKPGQAAHDDGEAGSGQMVQELFVAEVAYPQDDGELQVTLGPTFAKRRRANRWGLDLQVEYGVTDRLQASVELAYANPCGEDGAGGGCCDEVDVGMLYSFLTGRDPLVLSAQLGVGLPTGARTGEEGGSEVSWQPSLLAARRIGGAEMYLNVGGELSRDEQAFLVGVAAVHPVAESLFATLELDESTHGDTGGLYLTPGLISHQLSGRLLGERVEIGLGVPVGLAGGAARWALIAKITVEFETSEEQ